MMATQVTTPSIAPSKAPRKSRSHKRLRGLVGVRFLLRRFIEEHYDTRELGAANEFTGILPLLLGGDPIKSLLYSIR